MVEVGELVVRVERTSAALLTKSLKKSYMQKFQLLLWVQGLLIPLSLLY